MIYITFERGGPKFSNTTARALAYRTAVQQRQLRAKWLLRSTRFFFAFVIYLKPSRRLLCGVRFVFVSFMNFIVSMIECNLHHIWGHAAGGTGGRGTALQAGRSRVRFPIGSLEFYINIILPAALWPWG